MLNIGDYHYGFHCGAKQLKNMMYYEMCALFKLKNSSAAEMHR